MAPFNTHFLVAEKLWPDLAGHWQPYYGQFCFGCVAPDVDKLSSTLTQKDTHFFDRTGEYDFMASHRSATFIARQTEFLSQSFAHLSPEAQAFALGYLCHLCVDEVSKHLWRRDTWVQFKTGAGTSFSALDELARAQTRNYPAIAAALCSVKTVHIIPRIPPADLKAMLQGVCAFVTAATTEASYLALVDFFDHPTPEERLQKQQSFRTDLRVARCQAYLFRLDTLVRASLAHSRSRLADLIAGRLPSPGYPVLE